MTVTIICYRLLVVQVEQSVRYVCLCVRTITFELHNLNVWHACSPRTCTIVVKFEGQYCRLKSQDEMKSLAAPEMSDKRGIMA